MENQHQKIKGYRDLSADEIALMNAIKEAGEVLDSLLRGVQLHLHSKRNDAPMITATEAVEEIRRIDAAQPERWVAIARTDFQTGLMALTRAVAQPTTF